MDANVEALPASRSVAEIATAHKVGVATVWRAIARGELRARKLGRRTLVLLEDERAWLDSLPVTGGRAA